LHLSVLGWPIDGAGDDVKMGTSRSFSEGFLQNVEHVHGITDFPKPSGPSIVNGSISIAKWLLWWLSCRRVVCRRVGSC
jgi:hypothetical protein